MICCRIRMIVSFTLLLLIVYSVRVIQGNSSGAPPGSCSDMIPKHRVNPTGLVIPPQTTPLPYNLLTTSATYSAGQAIQMTLAGQMGTTFKGAFIKVTTAQGSSVGTMASPTGFQTVTCDTADDALTHSQGWIEKSDVTFTWTAPLTSSGPLTVRASMVHNYSTFWVDELLATLTPGTSSGSSLSPVVATRLTTAEVQGSSIRYDSECGSSKGCFVDCSGEDCSYMVTWRDEGQAVAFELYGKPQQPDSWIAVGFSKDARMGDDSVTECVHINGMVQAFNSYNPGDYNTRLTNSQVGLSDISGSFQDGVLSCRFKRAKRIDTEPNLFDLENDWHIMFAHGNAITGFGIAPHSVNPGELPPVSESQVDYQSFAVIGGAAKYPLVKAHGCLMIIAWVLFTSIGIITARFYKNVWSEKTLFDLKIWFQVHRFCMMTALVLDITAFVIIFVEVKGYSEIPDIPGKAYLKSHPILGIIVTALCLINPIMAFFRPGPKDSKRPLFNWAHWCVGVCAYILSALCISFGFQLGKSSTPDYTIYIMIGYVVYIVIFDLILDVYNCLEKKRTTGKIDSVGLTLKNGTDNDVQTEEPKKKNNDTMKSILLALHIAFTGAFSILLVLLVAMN